MNISGICLRTVKEQIDGGDEYLIDPSLIHNIPADNIPVTLQFTGLEIGTSSVRLEDGRLVANTDIHFDSKGSKPKLAVGCWGYGVSPGEGKTTLYALAIVDENKDKDIPNYTIS